MARRKGIGQGKGGGGWHGRINSLLALEACRAPGFVARRCDRPGDWGPGCTQPAVRGSARCRWHGGADLAAAQRGDRPARRAALDTLRLPGVVPLELARLAVWQECAARPAAARYRLLLFRGWCARDVDPGTWSRAVRDAHEFLGCLPPPPPAPPLPAGRWG